jgi:hypothetical protein
MVSGANADAFDFLKVGAVHAKPIIRAIYVNVFASGLELLARYRGTMMKRTQSDAVNVSSVFKVQAILTTLNTQHNHLHGLILDKHTLYARKII